MGKFIESVGSLALVAALTFVAFGIIVVLFWTFLSTDPSPFG